MVLTLYPSVHYHDSAKGIDWLVEYLGCKPLYLVEGPEGPHGRQVQHAELELGASAFFLGQKPPNTTASFGIYVGVSEAEIEALYKSLQQKGATFAKLMFTTPYDTKEFDVMDLENNIWTIGTYTPGSRGNGPGTHRRSYAGGLDKQA